MWRLHAVTPDHYVFRFHLILFGHESVWPAEWAWIHRNEFWGVA